MNSRTSNSTTMRIGILKDRRSANRRHRLPSSPLTLFHIGLTVLCSILVMIAALPEATAQRWEYVYGENASVQAGRRGVRPLSGACGNTIPGYVATGYSQNSSVDVYVVRTDNSGMSIWEQTYDINSGNQDYGESILELSDGSGFVVVGSTKNSSGDYDILLIRLACDGTALWKMTYGTSSALEYGYDVIEVDIGGNPKLIVAGAQDDGSNPKAVLMQADVVTGVDDWFRTYDQGGTTTEEFFSLTAVTPASGSTPDVIAVGRSGPYGAGNQGYVVRASLVNNGAAIGLAGLYGADLDEGFYSVIQLQNPAEIGTNGRPNVVIAGYSSSYMNVAGNIDMYFVKINGGEQCSPVRQRIVGYPSPNIVDVATSIKEITFLPSFGYQQWDIIVGGYGRDIPYQRDMALIAIAPVNLNISAPGWYYGHIIGSEEAWSVFPVPAVAGRTDGYVLCGSTTTPWHIGSYTDPGDLFIVKTDNATALDCQAPFSPIDPEVQWQNDCHAIGENSTNPEATPSLVETPQDWDDIVCTDGTNDGYAKRIPLEEELGTGQMKVQPNPISPGQSLILMLNGFNPDNDMKVSVTNVLGEIVTTNADLFTPSIGEIRLTTTGWPAGTYQVTVRNGDRKWMTKVAVLR